MDFRFDLIAEYAPYFVKGTLYTIGISLLSVLLGTILGLFLGLGKMINNKILSFPFKLYITFSVGLLLLFKSLSFILVSFPSLWVPQMGLLQGLQLCH